MKGISNLVMGVLLILMTVAVAVILTGWITTFAEGRSDVIENQTEQKLNCVYASMYIHNASYEGNCDCSSGTHNLSVTIRNNGGMNLDFNKAFLVNSQGVSYEFKFSSTTSDVGTLTTLTNSTASGASYNCSTFNETTEIDYIKITSTTCPISDELDGEDVNLQSC